jgi:hypothetical protein
MNFHGLSPDLCVPLGLVLPDHIEFLVEENREEEYVEKIPSIDDLKFEDLFRRIAYTHKPLKKNKTRKRTTKV